MRWRGGEGEGAWMAEVEAREGMSVSEEAGKGMTERWTETLVSESVHVAAAFLRFSRGSIALSNPLIHSYISPHHMLLSHTPRLIPVVFVLRIAMTCTRVS